LQAVLLDDSEELDGHAAGLFAPLSHFSTVDSLVLRVRAKIGWLTRWPTRIPLTPAV